MQLDIKISPLVPYYLLPWLWQKQTRLFSRIRWWSSGARYGSNTLISNTLADHVSSIVNYIVSGLSDLKCWWRRVCWKRTRVQILWNGLWFASVLWRNPWWFVAAASRIALTAGRWRSFSRAWELTPNWSRLMKKVWSLKPYTEPGGYPTTTTTTTTATTCVFCCNYSLVNCKTW